MQPGTITKVEAQLADVPAPDHVAAVRSFLVDNAALEGRRAPRGGVDPSFKRDLVAGNVQGCGIAELHVVVHPIKAQGVATDPCAVEGDRGQLQVAQAGVVVYYGHGHCAQVREGPKDVSAVHHGGGRYAAGVAGMVALDVHAAGITDAGEVYTDEELVVGAIRLHRDGSLRREAYWCGLAGDGRRPARIGLAAIAQEQEGEAAVGARAHEGAWQVAGEVAPPASGAIGGIAAAC